MKTWLPYVPEHTNMLAAMLQSVPVDSTQVLAAKPEHAPLLINAFINNWGVGAGACSRSEGPSRWGKADESYLLFKNAGPQASSHGFASADAIAKKAATDGFFLVIAGNVMSDCPPPTSAQCMADTLSVCAIDAHLVKDIEDVKYLASGGTWVRPTFVLYDPTATIINFDKPSSPAPTPGVRPEIVPARPPLWAVVQKQPEEARTALYAGIALAAVALVGAGLWMTRGRG